MRQGQDGRRKRVHASFCLVTEVEKKRTWILLLHKKMWGWDIPWKGKFCGTLIFVKLVYVPCGDECTNWGQPQGRSPGSWLQGVYSLWETPTNT